MRETPVLSALNRPGRAALHLNLALFVGAALALNALIYGFGWVGGSESSVDVTLPDRLFGLVWAALRRIPAGAAWSYKALAEHLGRPAAIRAVGLANGANPIGIVVPCHRVIGADGSLTGYGGGLPRKRWLLEHEGALLRIGA